MYYSKVYRQKGEILLAVCDKDIHDRTFDNGKLRFHVDPSFYGKDEIGEDVLKELFDEATIINLAGNRCIGLARKLGYVDLENVMEIESCSHAQVIKL